MISIIGAGPAGLYTAYLLKKLNPAADVNVFEKKPEIGKPVQCTGILTHTIKDVLDLDDLEKNNKNTKNKIIINKIKTARLVAPNNDYVDINLKNPDIIIDRERFDKYLGRLAKSIGVNIHLQHEFCGIESLKDMKLKLKIKNIKNNKIKTSSTKTLIGADGPCSSVAEIINKKRKSNKNNKKRKKKKFLTGIQARVRFDSKFISINKNIYEVYFGQNICPGFFAWLVPENENIARVGLATEKNSKQYFENFLKKIEKNKGNKGKFKIIEKQGGLIPVYNKKLKINFQNKIFLIGDAAAQVKATTGGGVVQALIAAKQLANSILDKNSTCKTYNKNLKKSKLMKNLNTHAKARAILTKFKDKDFNSLIKYLKKDSIKTILETCSRDNFASFALKLFIKEPKLLYFIGKFL